MPFRATYHQDRFRWENGEDLSNVTNWSDGKPQSKYPKDKCTLVTTRKGWIDNSCSERADMGVGFLPLCEKAVQTGKYDNTVGLLETTRKRLFK